MKLFSNNITNMLLHQIVKLPIKNKLVILNDMFRGSARTGHARRSPRLNTLYYHKHWDKAGTK